MTDTAARPTRRQLDVYGVVERDPEPELMAIARIAAQLAGVRTATVNLLDATQQYNVAAEGFEPATRPLEQSMCGVTVTLPGPVAVKDASRDPRWQDNPWVNGELGNVRFYAASQLRGDDGQVVGTLCVFDDDPHELSVDQRRGLEELALQASRWLESRRRAQQLEHAVGDLERSNADLAAFAGRVAHDLRNPLAAVSGFLQLADRRLADEMSERVHMVIRSALEASSRMSELLDAMLAFASVGASPRIGDVELRTVVENAIADVAPAIESAGATVDVDPLPRVRTDPTLVRQLVQNLLANAMKFGREDVVPRVRVTGGDDGDGWWLTIADNGRGVPAEDRERVFELFARAANATGQSGSGIGLATCVRIAEALGGTLTLDDTAGGGATFTLRVTDFVN